MVTTTSSSLRAIALALSVTAAAVTGLAAANTLSTGSGSVAQQRYESRRVVLEDIIRLGQVGYRSALAADKASDLELAAQVRRSSDNINALISRYQRLSLDTFESSVLNTELKPAQHLLDIALEDFVSAYAHKPATPAARKMILEYMDQSQAHLERAATILLGHAREKGTL